MGASSRYEDMEDSIYWTASLVWREFSSWTLPAGSGNGERGSMGRDLFPATLPVGCKHEVHLIPRNAGNACDAKFPAGDIRMDEQSIAGTTSLHLMT